MAAFRRHPAIRSVPSLQAAVWVHVADGVGEEVGHNLMKRLFSRKQFFAETLRQGLKAVSRCIDGDDARSNRAQTDHSTDWNCIFSDFSPTLLHLEAKRLGIDVEAIDSEDLLRTVYEVMKARHSSNGNTNDAPS